MAKKRKQNWRSRNQITKEVQTDLRRKGITINSKKTVGTKLGLVLPVLHNNDTRKWRSEP